MWRRPLALPHIDPMCTCRLPPANAVASHSSDFVTSPVVPLRSRRAPTGELCAFATYLVRHIIAPLAVVEAYSRPRSLHRLTPRRSHFHPSSCRPAPSTPPLSLWPRPRHLRFFQNPRPQSVQMLFCFPYFYRRLSPTRGDRSSSPPPRMGRAPIRSSHPRRPRRHRSHPSSTSLRVVHRPPYSAGLSLRAAAHRAGAPPIP